MEYYSQYLKYKNKYLNEKKNNIQKGGEMHNQIAVISSHGRLISKKHFKIPDNIDLLISDTCGLLNYSSTVYKMIINPLTNKIISLEYLTSLIQSNKIELSPNIFYKLVKGGKDICDVELTTDLLMPGFKVFELDSEVDYTTLMQNVGTNENFMKNMDTLSKFIDSPNEFIKINSKANNFHREFLTTSKLTYICFIIYI